MYCNETEPGKKTQGGQRGVWCNWLFRRLSPSQQFLLLLCNGFLVISDVAVNARLMFKVKRPKVFISDVVRIWWGKGFL